MSFAWPLALLSLLVVALLVAVYWWLLRRRRRQAVAAPLPLDLDGDVMARSGEPDPHRRAVSGEMTGPSSSSESLFSSSEIFFFSSGSLLNTVAALSHSP